MVSQNSEITRKLRAAVRQKIEEYGIDVDDELPDYVMIMIGNKKDKTRMKSDLKLFLGENTSNFVDWLFSYFQNLQKTKTTSGNNNNSSVPSSSAAVNLSTAPTKEKIILGDQLEFAETKILKKKTGNNSLSVNKARGKDEFKKNHTESKKSSNSRSPSPSNHHLRKNSSAEDKHRSQKHLNKNSMEKIATTTFALPRPILRSVVVNPVTTYHPRIRARTPSPCDPDNSDLTSVVLDNMPPSSDTDLDMKEKVTNGEEIRPHHNRRVMTASSLLFKNALPQNPQISTNADERKEPMHIKQENLHNKDQNEKEPMEKIRENLTIKQEEKSQQKCKMVTGRQGPLLVGIGAIFQRAIQETKKQNKVEEEQKVTNIEKRNEKRSFENDKQNSLDLNENDEHINIKKIRIDSTEKEIGDDASVLVVNMGKMANRSIQKQARPPKSSLLLLKEHIGQQTETSTVGEKYTKVKYNVVKNEKMDSGDKQQYPGIEKGILNIIGSDKYKQTPQQGDETDKNCSKTIISKQSTECLNETPHWDGRIEIEDIDDTDDEAEIDAVLQEQHKLRKMALERETEIKCMSLPPTAALTRPIYHHSHSMPISDTLSSGEAADLLPITFQQKSSVSQQMLTNEQQQNSATRPFATVAPCPSPSLTMPTTLSPPTTMIVHQQYHQQNAFTIGTQHLHPYNPTSFMMPMPIRQNHPIGISYKTPGSISKVYSAPMLLAKPAVNNVGEKCNSEIMLLKQQHRQTSSRYSNLLEEQRLLLAQIQKMATNPNQEEQRKNLLFKCKQMDRKATELKEQLEKITDQISKKGQKPSEVTSGLLVKRFY